MERRHIKVLLIEDNQGDVRLIWEILSEVRNSPFYLEVADSLKGGLEAIDKKMPDVILLDLSLPDSNGIYTLNRVRDRAKVIPVVIITGLDDEMTAMKALKEGAQDYLVKGRTDSDLLKRALIYAIERNKLILELEETEVKGSATESVAGEIKIHLDNIVELITGLKNEDGKEVVVEKLRNEAKLALSVIEKCKKAPTEE